MASLPNPGDIAKAAVTAASGVINKDITAISGFAKDQLQRLERLSLLFAKAQLAGEFDGDTEARDDYLHILQNVARDFATTLRGLSMITIEKIWNAVVNAVWGVLQKSLGVTLPVPL